MIRLHDLETALLTTWCDTLLDLQLDHENERFDGGILCPSCLHLHGRIIDLLYPLCYLGNVTGNERYIIAAKRIFIWGEQLYCDDHSYYNDAQQTWNKTTIFFAQSLMQALKYHGDVLDHDTKQRWEQRLREVSEWMMDHFPVDDGANTNYHASCCAALAMSATYFQEPSYMEKASAIKAFCEQFMSEDGLFYGEGNPRAYKTIKGCVSIDIGYSMEESLPGLIEYAHYAKDDAFMKRLADMMKRYLDFMLPDGGMDNSFGTRNFKWTYWGSRTSDGCCKALHMLSHYDPVFLEACNRQLTLLKSCTHNGFLYGGPHYVMHQEEPCIHHMFAHAKALAGCLDMEEATYVPTSLPLEVSGYAYYPSLDTHRVHTASLQATITAFDYSHFEGGHVSGGVLSMLYHKRYGPVIACGITDTTSREPLNTQLSLKKQEMRSSAWRICYEKDGSTYANVYDLQANIQKDASSYFVTFHFADLHHCHDDQSGTLIYTMTEEEVTITGDLQTRQAAKLMLPIIVDRSVVCTLQEHLLTVPKPEVTMLVASSHKITSIQDTFSLAPGFCCKELLIELEPNAHFTLCLKFSSPTCQPSSIIR